MSASLDPKGTVPNTNTTPMIPGLGLLDSVPGSSSDLSTVRVPVNPIILVTSPAGVSIDVKYAGVWRQMRAPKEHQELTAQWYKSEVLSPFWQSRANLHSLVVETRARELKRFDIVIKLKKQLADNRQDLDKIAPPGRPGGYFHNPRRDFLSDERRRLKDLLMNAENALAQKQIEAMKARLWHSAREVDYSYKPTPPQNSRAKVSNSRELPEKRMTPGERFMASLKEQAAQKESGQQRTPLPDRPTRPEISA